MDDIRRTAEDIVRAMGPFEGTNEEDAEEDRQFEEGVAMMMRALEVWEAEHGEGSWESADINIGEDGKINVKINGKGEEGSVRVSVQEV